MRIVVNKLSWILLVGFQELDVQKYQDKDDTKVFVWRGKQVVLSSIEKDTFKSCIAQQVGDARSHYNRKGRLDKVVTHINEQVILSILDYATGNDQTPFTRWKS